MQESISYRYRPPTPAYGVGAELLVLLCAVLWWLSSPPTARAQCETAAAPEIRQDTTIQKNGRWTILPIISSSPNTGFAGGVLPQYIFRSTPGSRPSNIRLDGYFTQQRQFHVQLTSQLWLRNDRYRLAGKLVFKDWPTSFYGIGRNSSSAEKEKYTEELASFTLSLQTEVRPGIYLGAGYQLRSAAIRDTEPHGVLSTSDVPGSSGGKVSGLGMRASWDTRDNLYYPSSGRFYQVSLDLFEPALGSDYAFGSYSVDLREYLSRSRHVLALQVYAGFTSGTPPFRLLSGVGDILRAYPSSRYVDRNVLAIQAEYRLVPVWWRLGFVLFGGVADVADTPTGFRFDKLKPAVGIGVRFQLYAGERINVRWDYGVGRHSSGDYLDLSEAF